MGAEVAGGRPRLSVVVPVHGRAQLARRALRSVLTQSVRDLEVVVVDDGTPDAIDEALGEPDIVSDDRVRVISHPSRRGAAASRNSGVKAARARLVAFLDSDDEWLAGMASALLSAVGADEGGPVGATTAFSLVRPSGREHPRAATPRTPLVREAVRGCRLAPGSTLVIRRQAWLEIGGEDESLERLEDWDLLLRLAGQGWELNHVPRVLARVYQSSPGPVPMLVSNCAGTIVERHMRWVTTASPGLAKRLSGAAAWEEIVALARHGETGHALVCLARALVRTPLVISAYVLESLSHQKRPHRSVKRSRRAFA